MKNIVLLSTADWDNPFWTNKQHVACELVRLGHKVLYIDSLGLRRPSASKQDINRIFNRLIKALRHPRQVRPNLWVWSPIVIPFQNYKFVQYLNKVLLQLGLKFWMWRLNFNSEVFWTYNPMTLRFFNIDSFPTAIYHCVDDITAQPGMPVNEIREAENELVTRVSTCFVTSESLLSMHKDKNPRTYYFSNVADYNHFSQSRLPETQIPDDISNISKPIIGFVGAISGYKVDFGLLREMASSHPDWSIVLIGKIGEGDPWTDVTALKDLNNVIFLGPKDYQTLPNYMKAFDVAILPSLLNEYTKSMFPMKFYEYLAAGLPVVSTALHSLEKYEGLVYLAKTNEDFIFGVEKALRDGNFNLEERLACAKEQTYEHRTKKMFDIITSNT